MTVGAEDSEGTTEGAAVLEGTKDRDGAKLGRNDDVGTFPVSLGWKEGAVEVDGSRLGGRVEVGSSDVDGESVGESVLVGLELRLGGIVTDGGSDGLPVSIISVGGLLKLGAFVKEGSGVNVGEDDVVGVKLGRDVAVGIKLAEGDLSSTLGASL